MAEDNYALITWLRLLDIKSLPSIGWARNSEKRLTETLAPSTCSGVSRAVRLPPQRVHHGHSFKEIALLLPVKKVSIRNGNWSTPMRFPKGCDCQMNTSCFGSGHGQRSKQDGIHYVKIACSRQFQCERDNGHERESWVLQ
jgi:hypothetical protein